jgi:flagellar basal-body rod protein FlgB
MIPGLFGDPTQKALRTALTGLQLRQQTIANNIANVDTPNYRARAVAFEDALQAQLAGSSVPASKVVRLGLDTTDTRHIPIRPRVESFDGRPSIFESNDGTLRNDGNTVDVEREMARLAETQITYNAIGQMTSGKLGILRTAINEGRK